MSTINAQNFGDGTDSVPASAVLEGTAKAWGRAATNLASLDDSYNISSVTDLNTGSCEFNLTNDFAANDYFQVVSSVATSDNIGCIGGTSGAGKLGLFFQRRSDGATSDPTEGAHSAAHGDLA